VNNSINVTASGGAVSFGNVVQGDGNTASMTNSGAAASADGAAVEIAMRPLYEAVEKLPADRRSQVSGKLDELKTEIAKGKDAKDGVLAKIVDGLVKLAPEAVGAVVSAFATPLLAALAGPVTKFVLEKIK